MPKDLVRPGERKPSLLLSSSCKIFEISSPFTQGLYILSGALDKSSQIRWARTAVKEYSTTEHTNLTNLRRIELQKRYSHISYAHYYILHNITQSLHIRRTICNSSNHTPLHSVSVDSEIVPDFVMDKSLSTLWDQSLSENNEFRSFFKLRWSSLGYHYGILTFSMNIQLSIHTII